MMEKIHFLVNVQLVIPLHLDMDKCVAIASKMIRAKQLTNRIPAKSQYGSNIFEIFAKYLVRD